MKKFNKYFGSVTTFPDRYNIDSPLVDDVQPPGNEECVCYMVDDICQDKLGVEIDIDFLYSQVPHAQNGGTNPYDVLKQVTNFGVKIKSTGEIIKPFTDYFRAHTGQFDAFDNVRSALMLCKYSIGAWGPWGRLWGISSLMDIETDFPTGHAVSIKGWDIINDEPQLIIEAHNNHFLYCSRSIFNSWALMNGFDTVVLSDQVIDTSMINSLRLTVISLLQTLLDKLLKKK